MEILGEVQQAKLDFAHDPQEVIARLFGLEKAIVGIYGSSQDPIVANVARRIFVEKLYQNIKENLLYISLLAKLYGSAESKVVADRATKLGKEMEEYEQKNKDKAVFLNKKFKEANVKTKTRAKLIPSFETFNNAISRLENVHHILASIPTLDKRAEVAYYLTIGSAWNEQNKQLLAKLVQESKTGQHTSEHVGALNFYDLIHIELTFRIERLHKIKNYRLEKETLTAFENYPVLSMTEVEGEFIITYLGLVVRH